MNDLGYQDLVALRRNVRRHSIVIDTLSRNTGNPTPITQREYTEEREALYRAIDRLLIEHATLRNDATGTT